MGCSLCCCRSFVIIGACPVVPGLARFPGLYISRWGVADVVGWSVLGTAVAGVFSYGAFNTHFLRLAIRYPQQRLCAATACMRESRLAARPAQKHYKTADRATRDREHVRVSRPPVPRRRACGADTRHRQATGRVPTTVHTANTKPHDPCRRPVPADTYRLGASYRRCVRGVCPSATASRVAAQRPLGESVVPSVDIAVQGTQHHCPFRQTPRPRSWVVAAGPLP